MSFPPQQTVSGERLLTLRYEVAEADIQRVREIVDSTGFFHPPEVDVAVELVEERLRRGDASGYFFAFVGLHVFGGIF